MKGFKKLALVAAIAAPFSSVHALEALDDSMLSDMTGQSGVTIELSTRVTMDKFAWIDTDGEGGVAINNLAIGGWGAAYGMTDNLDDVLITIDSESTGDLVINIGTISGAPVDLGLDVGSVNLATAAGGAADAVADGAVIASNINLNVLLAPQQFRIVNTGNDATTGLANNALIQAQGYFQLHESSSMDLDVAGISLTGLKMGEFLGTEDADAASFTGVPYNSKAALGTDTAFSYYNVTIGTTDSAAVDAGTGAAVASDALNLTINNFETDLTTNVAIGGASIGSIAMTNLSLDGTSLTVYGH